MKQGKLGLLWGLENVIFASYFDLKGNKRNIGTFLYLNYTTGNEILGQMDGYKAGKYGMNM